MLTLKKHILATRVGHYVNNSVRVLTRGLDISLSEYLRKLILQDLDSRRLFDDELARSIERTKNLKELKHVTDQTTKLDPRNYSTTPQNNVGNDTLTYILSEKGVHLS